MTAAAAGLTREPCAQAPSEGVAQAEVRGLLRGVSLPPGVSRPGVGARKGQDGWLRQQRLLGAEEGPAGITSPKIGRPDWGFQLTAYYLINNAIDSTDTGR